MARKYNHAFDLGFSVISEFQEPTTEQIIKGLEERVAYLKENRDEIPEACEKYDTYEFETKGEEE